MGAVTIRCPSRDEMLAAVLPVVAVGAWQRSADGRVWRTLFRFATVEQADTFLQAERRVLAGG